MVWALPSRKTKDVGANVAVTGVIGSVECNLVENVRTLADGHNRTRPALTVDEVWERDLGSTPEELDERCSKACSRSIWQV